MTLHYPYRLRLRLRGGRNTHAARLVRPPDDTTALVTACGYIEGNRDQRKPDDDVVTCRTCVRIITAEEHTR